MNRIQVQIGKYQKISVLFVTVVMVLVTTGCGFIELAQKAVEIKTITPSGVIISETRDVSGFTGLDVKTLGTVTLTQGDQESLTVSGSDNLVERVMTRVSNGTLIIEMEENVVWSNMTSENGLSFDITLKDLGTLSVSGLADVEMDELVTSDLGVTLSGAGNFKLKNLTAESIDIIVSGLGNVEIAGQVVRQTIKISGAGEVNNADLQCETANVDVPGLGTATIWATEMLNGTISGGGSVRYYGSPETDTGSTGLGKFEALGNK